MKKTNLLKVFFGLVLSVMVIFIATSVSATDGFTDMTNSLVNSNSTGNNLTVGNNSTNTNTSNSNSNSTNTNTNTNRSNVSNTNSNRTNNSSSIYNNTSLPSTGIGDSLPIAALVVVFGISAVYAYKKIKDYRNI